MTELSMEIGEGTRGVLRLMDLLMMAFRGERIDVFIAKISLVPLFVPDDAAVTFIPLSFIISCCEAFNTLLFCRYSASAVIRPSSPLPW